MYYDYVRERAPVIGLSLAVVALVVASSLDDLLAALALIGAGFIIFSPAWYYIRAQRRPFEGNARWVLLGVYAILWGLLIVTLVQSVVAGEFENRVEDFQVLGAGIGAIGLLFLVGHHIPIQSRERTECPECMNVVHAKARVCHFCGYRWKPPLSKSE